MTQDYRSLRVWSESHRLTLELYRITDAFPREELYGLTSQIRRSSLSIPANLAEACGHSGTGDFGRFVQIAIGSASELDYLLLFTHDRGLIDPGRYADLMRQLTTIRKRLFSLRQRSITNNQPPTTR